MIKFISKLKASEVILFQERARLGKVVNILIDPKDGSFVGLSVNLAKEGVKYIPTSEIKGYGSGLVMINDLNSLSDEDDVVKIKEVIDSNPQIIAAKVYTESGSYVGKVNDATINLELMSLAQLYIRSGFLVSLVVSDRIISAKQIVKIEKKKIIVTDSSVARVLRDPVISEAKASE